MCMQFQGVPIHLESFYSFFKNHGPLGLRNPGPVKYKTLLKWGGGDNSKRKPKRIHWDNTNHVDNIV